VTLAERRTEPPKAFSDASLIQAMCNVARFVKHPSVKKILTETDGIGTPATRASILEVLLERGYAARVKKTIRSTPTGRALIQSLPAVATTPEMTAVWEAAMRAIHDGEQTLEAFLSRVTAQLRQLIEQGRKVGSIAVPPTSSGEPGKRVRGGDGNGAQPSNTPRRHPSAAIVPRQGR
jgi:DNA topoisomerase-3